MEPLGRAVLAGVAALVLLPLAVRRSAAPTEPPPQYHRKPVARQTVIRVHVAYDRDVAARHGPALEWTLREALALHSMEWRQYRSERFELASMRLLDTGREHDGIYVLSRFFTQTDEAPHTIHVLVVGRTLDVYAGSRRIRVRGLALRGSDALLVSATQSTRTDVLAYYLFHEIGHLWGTHDLPFAGGNSTYGSKSAGYSYALDVGNAEILQASSGPAPRRTPKLAPAIISHHLDRARRLTPDARLRKQLLDIVLHQPSPANQIYQRKKRALLAAAGGEGASIRGFLRQFEKGGDRIPGDVVRDQRRIADHYWRANELIASRQYRAAEREITALQSIAAGSADVHLLVAAMEKKIRNRR
jgi:hypothetical protein